MGNRLRFEEVLARLSAWAAPESLPGMARYGILTDRALGVSMPKLRSLAKECGKDHDLAAKLWAGWIHEARILASLVEEPGEVNEEQTERWVCDFDSWDLTDQTCASLFRRLPWAWEKIWQWGRREEEYVRRASFSLLAVLAVHDRSAPDERFESYFPLVLEGAEDSRNYVKKGLAAAGW
ncbi:MAG: DNA alkylation repair protein [Coprothermobacterota bacterium]|nr:DNA alkylation repair protein [Coprothermobacterota bacterium]